MITQSEQQVLLHIGYHKTGSSYLQKKFFVGERGFARWPENQRGVHAPLIDLGPYDEVSDETIAMLKSNAARAEASGVQFVVSHERLSGHPSSGGYDAKIIANRLKAIFPTARVLIVIREQTAFIRSAYSQFVTEGGSLPLKKWLSNPEPGLRKTPLFSLSHFEFAPAIQYYQGLFGDANVMVLPYEYFHSTPVDFLNRIGEFAVGDAWDSITPSSYQSVLVNKGKTVLMQTFRRGFNAVLMRSQLGNSSFVHLPALMLGYKAISPVLDVLVPGFLDRRMSKVQQSVIRRFVGDYFREFNRKTAEITGLDLKSLGYEC